jgi:peptidoglycan hydrolase-like protein with peptidoglycan-binding domain
MKTPFRVAAVGMMLSACAEQDAQVDPIEGDQAELVLGDRGEEVRELHDYLRRYGYFPNDELAKQYPAWRPLVAEAPSDESTFDERTQRAVELLQASQGLEVTGTADEATRELLEMPRCARPEGIEALDASNKFALYPQKWATTGLRYKIMNTDDGLLGSELNFHAAQVVQQWMNQTSLTATRVGISETADITIKFEALTGSLASALAITQSSWFAGSLNFEPAVIKFDTAETWTFFTTGGIRWQQVLLHEFGHALGFEHSSIFSVMKATYQEMSTSLTNDDEQAISTKYDKFELVSGSGRDIAVNNVNSEVWLVGGNQESPGNYGIFKWDGGTSWIKVIGSGARVAVMQGSAPYPVVVTSAGDMWIRNSADPANGTWIPMTGCARDIATGADGSLWVIGCTAVAGGLSIHKGVSGGWQLVSGGAVRIAVGQFGRPWVVNADGRIFRKTGDPVTGAWEEPDAGARAKEISINRYGHVYIVGTDNLIYVWNEQTGTGGDQEVCRLTPGSTTCARKQFVKISGTPKSVSIAAAANRIWSISPDTAISRTIR